MYSYITRQFPKTQYRAGAPNYCCGNVYFIYSKSLILLNRLLGVIPACLYEDMCIPGVIVGTACLCAERCWAGKPRATTAVVVAGLTRGG